MIWEHYFLACVLCQIGEGVCLITVLKLFLCKFKKKKWIQSNCMTLNCMMFMYF